MTIQTLVWGENVHEQINRQVGQLYPDGMHCQIARLLTEDKDLSVSTATLRGDQHGLSDERLETTDVLLWWGHQAHEQVSDEVVERIIHRVWQGMGLIVLHSGHFSKPFKRLMGTPCSLKWREAGEKERLWVVNPSHPIAKGLPQYFELENEEMYGEPFTIPDPLETVFISWFEGGEVFRSGLTYKRGAGHIFYFRPGHETYPTYYNPHVGQALRNAVHWAYNPSRVAAIADAPNVPADEAPEQLALRSEDNGAGTAAL
ncbi:ThuA domain-containing protein [Pseudochrobactrum sp. B5]|uniref:ThuA domain-containing protein n=1 Tax=Pseudochrobactrum sp. B5 TaxID=1289478 RepID=UPI000951F0A6|nr:ThuA domain-containing protein [Pseudochrobactrum sp. B5]